MSKYSGTQLFESAPVPQAFFTMTIPVVLGQLINIFYNMADTWFVAMTGSTALVAGVSLCGPFFMLTVALGDLFGLGSASVMSRLFGRKDVETGSRIGAFSFWCVMAAGALVALLTLCFRDPLLRLLGAEDEVLVHARQYLTWLALGTPALSGSVVFTNQLRTEGLAKETMLASVTGSVANIILDPLFIFTFGMGAAGAAIATVLGSCTTMAMQAFFLKTRTQNLTVSLKKAHVSGSEFTAVLAIGFPASISNLMQSLSQALMNRALVPYGVEKVAAFGIAGKLYLFLVLTTVGFAFGNMPLLGYSFGSGDKQRLSKIIRFALLVEVCTGLLGGGLLALCAPGLLKLFMDDPAVITAGAHILRCMVLSAPVTGVFLVFSTLFQAAGKALPTTILNLSRQGVIFAVCLALLGALFGYSGIVFTQPLSDVLTLVLALILFRRSGIDIKA